MKQQVEEFRMIRLLRSFCDAGLFEGIEGDLQEIFELDQVSKGRTRAIWNLHWRAAGFFRLAFKQRRQKYGSSFEALFRNYITMILRNARRNRASSFINLIGLTLGLTTCAFLSQYILAEWNHDRHFSDYERIYRLVLDMEFGDDSRALAITPSGFGKLVTEKLPQVEQYAMLRRYSTFQFKKEEEKIRLESIYRTNENLHEIFDYEWISGNAKTALEEPYSIVLTESSAVKLFGTIKDYLGRAIETDQFSDVYTVTGIIKDPPVTSHIHPDAFISLYDQDLVNKMDSWRWCTYIKLKEGTSIAELRTQFDELSIEIFGESGGSGRGRVYINDQQLTDIHFTSKRDFEMEANEGNLLYLKGFIVLMVVLLSMSIINYMNLTTAQAGQRLKEVSVRKTFGAYQGELRTQFLFETTVYVLSASLISVTLVWLGKPFFEEYTGLNLSLGYLIAPKGILWLLLITSLVILFSGLYPAFFLTRSNNPTKAWNSQSNSTRFRSLLVTVQLTLSVLVIIGTAIIHNQIRFMTDRSLGFDRELILKIPLSGAEAEHFWLLREELKSIPGVVEATHAEQIPGTKLPINNFEFDTPDGTKKVVCPHLWVDQNFIQALSIPLVAGSNFPDHRLADGKRVGVMINEEFARINGWANQEAVGKKLRSGTRWEDKIIGVVRDFHFTSLHNPIEPMVIRHVNGGHHMLIKLESTNISEKIAQIEQVWSAITETPLDELAFLDQHFDQQYAKDQKRAQLFSLLTGLIIFISLSGLYGLTTYSAQRRMKEMSIRKVHGATLLQILGRLIRHYGLILILSLIISVPISYIVFGQWLKNFAYAIDVEWMDLLIPALAVGVFVLCITTMRSLKVAAVNPAETLRNE